MSAESKVKELADEIFALLIETEKEIVKMVSPKLPSTIAIKSVESIKIAKIIISREIIAEERLAEKIKEEIFPVKVIEDHYTDAMIELIERQNNTNEPIRDHIDSLITPRIELDAKQA